MDKHFKQVWLVAAAFLPLAAQQPVAAAPAAQVNQGVDQGFGLGLDLAEPHEPIAARLPQRLPSAAQGALAMPAAPLPAPLAAEPEAVMEAFDEDCVTINPLLAAPGRFQPMIQEQDAGLVASEHFSAMAPKLAELNRLCYFRGGMQSDESGAAGNWTLPGLPGWQLWNFNAVRGLWQMDQDRNAGFVGYHPGENTVVVCFHGAATVGDWLENLKAWAEPVDSVATPGEKTDAKVRLENAAVDPLAKVMVGKVHHGFLRKALSCRLQIKAHVDAILAGLSPAQRAQTRFYVTGHQQGAALGQTAIAWLCRDLRQHYGADFHNARDNRVQGWFLASPAPLDATAAAFVNGSVGTRNMLIQESSLDLAIHGSGMAAAGGFKSAGTLAVQSNWDTFSRSVRHYRNTISRHWANGEYRAALASLVPANPFRASAGSAHRMSASSSSENFVMDPAMIAEVQSDITWALQNARDREQEALRQKDMSWGQWFNYKLGW